MKVLPDTMSLKGHPSEFLVALPVEPIGMSSRVDKPPLQVAAVYRAWSTDSHGYTIYKLQGVRVTGAPCE